VTYHVASTTDSASNVGNTATAKSDENGPTTGSDTVDIVESVVLSVTKTFTSATAVAGGSAQTFKVDVTNTGVSDADNLLLTDTVDSRLIVDGVTGDFTCPGSGQSISCNLGHLAAGATKSITVTYHVASTTDSAASVGNTASAKSDENGPTTGSASVAITEDVTLAVTKTFAPTSVTAGTGGHAFTVSVENNGVSDADNVQLTDSVDPRLIVDSINAGSYTCGAPGQSISCSLGHLATGDTRSITVTYHVAASTPADPAVGNTGTASSDEAPATNGGASVAITTSADLSIAKIGPATAIAGNAFDYTLTVHNGGPSDHAGGFHVTDTLPAGTTFQTAGSTAGCGAVGQVVTCTSAAGLAVNGDRTFTIHVTLAAGAASGSTLSNSASVTTDGTLDPTAPNTSNTVTTTVQSSADVAITKTGPATATAGTAFSYTLTVTSNGPSNAQAVLVNDTLPSSFTGATWTLDSVSQGAWSGSASLGTMTPSQTHTIVITGTPTQAGTITNQANVSSTTNDPASPNNTSDTVSTTVSAGAPNKLLWTQDPTDTVAAKPITPSPLRHADSTLVCYQAKVAKSTIAQNACGPLAPKDKGAKIVPPQVKHEKQLAFPITGQFGSTTVDTVKEIEVCMPQMVELPLI
jgi:uncharacterized repeat protein (TIGR01451 family)